MKIFTIKPKNARNLAAIMALTLALGGCISGGKPFAYTEIHEIPAGPGLLTGDEGGYSITLGSNKGQGQIARRQQTELPASPPPPAQHRRMVEAVTQQ